MPRRAWTQDHVPPKAIFAPEDRPNSMRMPTHERCNCGLSGRDKACVQLFGLLRGRPHKEWTEAQYEAWVDENGDIAAFTVRGIDPAGMIWRWVRACHAALYATVLPEDTAHRVWEPMPSAAYPAAEPVELPKMEFVGKDYHALRLILQRSLLGDSADRLEANGGKWRYACTWKADVSGGWFCVWALDLYSSHRLGDSRAARACLGVYQLDDKSRPTSGATEAALAVDASSLNSVDPFDCWRE